MCGHHGKPVRLRHYAAVECHLSNVSALCSLNFLHQEHCDPTKVSICRPLLARRTWVSTTGKAKLLALTRHRGSGMLADGENVFRVVACREDWTHAP